MAFFCQLSNRRPISTPVGANTADRGVFVPNLTSMQTVDPQPKNNQLLKILGVGFGIAVTIGGTIGTGILRKPGPIANALGDPWLIMGVWVLVSIYAFLGVLCTIELGVTFPRAGAWYVYAKRAFGGYAGFVVGFKVSQGRPGVCGRCAGRRAAATVA